MSTPVNYDPYSAQTANAPVVPQAPIPGNAVAASGMTINTSEMNFASYTSGGLFGYTGTPGSNNLFFSVSPVGGTDNYGNNYGGGLTVYQGALTGVSITAATVDSTTVLLGTTINQAAVTQPVIQGGTQTSTLTVLNNAGGQVLSYSANTVVSTYTATGSTPWTCPAGVTQINVQCWGAGAGGGGGNQNQGGETGGGGEFAQEPNLTVIPGSVYTITVGAGGSGGVTGYNGTSGNPSSFSLAGSQLVYANGGAAGYYGNGGSGGQGSTNTVHYNGGGGAGASGNDGGSGGGSSAGTAATGASGNGSGSNTGAAGGTAPGGGGSGGTGGNDGNNGNTGSAPGGGGGGAGAGNGTPSATTQTWYPTNSYSYYGSAASGSYSPYTLRGQGTMYQGGVSSAGNTGGQYSYALFDYSEIQSALSGATINTVEIQLECLYGYYGGVYPGIGWSNNGNIGRSYCQPGGGDNEDVYGSTWFTAGETKVVSVTGDGFGTAFQDGSAYALMLSAGSGNGYNYGYFYGAQGSDSFMPALIINYTPSGGTNEVAGNGAAGQVVLTYSTTSSLVGAISPSSGTDGNGNSFNAGITTTQHTLLQQTANPPSPASSGAGAGAALAASSNNQLVTSSNGASWYLDKSQTTVATFSNNGASTALTALSTGWVIPSGDASAGTIYEVEIWGNATWPAQTLTFLMGLNGSSNQNGTFTIGAALTAAGTVMTFDVRYLVQVESTGVSGSMHVNAAGMIGQSQGNRLDTIITTMNADVDDKSINTSVNNTVAIYCSWGGTGGSPAISSYGSRFTRRGP